MNINAFRFCNYYGEYSVEKSFVHMIQLVENKKNTYNSNEQYLLIVIKYKSKISCK